MDNRQIQEYQQEVLDCAKHALWKDLRERMPIATYLAQKVMWICVPLLLLSGVVALLSIPAGLVLWAADVAFVVWNHRFHKDYVSFEEWKSEPFSDFAEECPYFYEEINEHLLPYVEGQKRPLLKAEVEYCEGVVRRFLIIRDVRSGAKQYIYTWEVAPIRRPQPELTPQQ
jgi:hypothetical protein